VTSLVIGGVLAIAATVRYWDVSRRPRLRPLVFVAPGAGGLALGGSF
jgi:hypothetical protein